jgi:hypothetical protein
MANGVRLPCSDCVEPGSKLSHLFRYVQEQVFRYNFRKDINDSDRFTLAMSQIVGKRLTYAEVTGKVGGNGTLIPLTSSAARTKLVSPNRPFRRAANRKQNASSGKHLNYRPNFRLKSGIFGRSIFARRRGKCILGFTWMLRVVERILLHG